MDFRNFKIIKKDDIDTAQDKIQDEIFNQFGFNKYYVLGEINLLKYLIETVGNKDALDKSNLLFLLKSFPEVADTKWSQEIVDAIVKKYE